MKKKSLSCPTPEVPCLCQCHLSGHDCLDCLNGDHKPNYELRQVFGGGVGTTPHDQAWFERGRQTERQEIRKFVMPRVLKFIKKVESGQARSVETYRDLKEIREYLKGDK
jgi:hypothetical protein